MQIFEYIQSNHNWCNKEILHRCYRGDACSLSTRRAPQVLARRQLIHVSRAGATMPSVPSVPIPVRGSKWVGVRFFARQVCDIRAKELMKQGMQDFGDVLCLPFLWSCQRQKFHSCNISDFCAQECTKVVLTVRSLVFFSGAGWLDFQDRKHFPGWNTPDKTSTSILTAKHQKHQQTCDSVSIWVNPKEDIWSHDCHLWGMRSEIRVSKVPVKMQVSPQAWTFQDASCSTNSLHRTLNCEGHSARCPTETAGCRCYKSCWAGCWSSGICVIKICWKLWWCVHAAVLD